MNVRIPKRMNQEPPIRKRSVVVADLDVVEAVKDYNDMILDVNSRLVDRDEEMKVVAFALLTKQHVMLNGLHGIAKSSLALHVFQGISGGSIYEKQLMKGTMPDEIFGPMSIKQFRENEIWTVNTANMLPEVDFAFLDEIYRASDMVLPSMMSVLNERTYMNGTVKMRCPLTTAIATCNFTVESEELKAFQDRWLLHVDVQPLKADNHRVDMLRAFMAEAKGEQAQISLESLQFLQERVRQIRVPEAIMRIYVEMVSRYRQDLPKEFEGYISDRRLCWALRLAQAAALLRDAEATEIAPEDLSATGYGIYKTNEKSETMSTLFQQVFKTAVDLHQRYSKETDAMMVFSEAVRDYLEQCDPSLSKVEAKKLYDKVRRCFSSLQNMPTDQMPILPANQNSYQESLKRCEDLIKELTPLAGNLIK